MLDACARTAASLAYTSLLSLVPLMAVMILILTAFPELSDIGEDIETMLFSSFVPGTSSAILEHLHQFSTKAAGLGMVGLFFLVATSLSMMSTIEGSFNVIWRVRDNRGPINRFLIYWAVLTLGPMLIGAGFVATTYVVSLPLINEFDQNLGLRNRLLAALPALMAMAAFSLLYSLVPNRRVPIRHALIGGLLAGILFEVAKRGFAYYVTHFPTQQAIYGAFASVPLFLLWIYVSWVIILLGAVTARSLMAFRKSESSYWARNRFYILFRTMGHFWLQQKQGGGLRKLDILNAEPEISDDSLDEMLDLLEQQEWIGRLSSDRMALLVDLDDITIAALWQLLPDAPHAHAGLPSGKFGWNQRLTKLLKHQDELYQMHLNVSLVSLYQDEEDAMPLDEKEAQLQRD